MENTIQDGENTRNNFNKGSKGVLIAGYILLLVGIINIAQELYNMWDIFFQKSGGILLNPLWLHSIQSLIVNGIGIIISSFAIIRRQKWGMYVLATLTLSAIVSISVAIIQSLLYSHLTVIGGYSGAFLYNGTQFFILIYLWKNKQELL